MTVAGEKSMCETRVEMQPAYVCVRETLDASFFTHKQNSSIVENVTHLALVQQ